MKIFALLTLAATALAQKAGLNLPGGTNLTAGSEIIVRVTRVNSLTGSTELAVAIGLQSCPKGNCIPADEMLGTAQLYHGDFNPQFHEDYPSPYENFTVTIPASTPKGKAVVAVAHAALVGASNEPLFEVLNSTVTIA